MSAEPFADPFAAGAPRLLDLLLDEESRLSAVERFSQRHAEAEGRLEASHYEDLIPLSRPAAGEQYAFRVDLDACTGCKACVTACHNLNGLDPSETWRRVGRLVGGSAEQPLQQTVTTACHHCEDPGCLKGCPVRAYEKDPETGIVRHLDDQCIGCKYCTLTCPYDVPQYSPERGIVRKCDMCSSRLAQGEPPACVQGCPNGAISIRVVSVRGEGARVGSLLPAAEGTLAPSWVTRPTTRYRTRRTAPRLVPADVARAEPAAAHWPLVVLLVATQLSVGLLSVATLLRWLGVGAAGVPAHAAVVGFAALGQAAAFLHLGRPLYAFRAVLGLRTSWMSREIVVLGAYCVHAVAALALLAAPGLAPGLVERIPAAGFAALREAAALAALALGWAGIAASAMIYVATRRPLWTFRRTAPRFFGSACVLGPAAALVVCLGSGGLHAEIGFGLLLMLAAALAAKDRFEGRLARALAGAHEAALRRSAALLVGALAGRAALRRRLAGGGGVALATAWALSALGASTASAAFALAGFAALAAGELLERNLFFTAEASAGVPGDG